MERCGVLLLLLPLLLVPGLAQGASVPDTIDQVRPSIIAVGTVQQTRRPPANFLGTGFVVGDGRHVITNAHVIPEVLDVRNMEFLAVFVGRGKRFESRKATKAAVDLVHDLALLKIEGSRLPALSLGDSGRLREGQDLLFTGFPIGVVLGLFPVTHRAMISAISPVAFPVPSASNLDPQTIHRLRNPFDVIQLDGTAYPGNSGSPLYQSDSGQVMGVINKVFVKQSKETVIQDPSGITYAIPASHIRALLRKAGVPER